MSARYALTTSPNTIKQAFGLDRVPDFQERYNIAPSQIAPVLRLNDDGQLKCEMMRWGLIPHWAKDAKIGKHAFNADIESAGSDPAFRDAWKRRRCIVPTTGFYTWKDLQTNQPYFVHRKDGRPFVFAGLWESWNSPEGELHTYTIMTTHADALLKPIHDRMPVILSWEGVEKWLLFTRGAKRDYNPADMEMYPVSTYVNKPSNEGPGCALLRR